MKKKTIAKKLVLRKKTIVNLSSDETRHIIGGTQVIDPVIKPTKDCPLGTISLCALYGTCQTCLATCP